MEPRLLIAEDEERLRRLLQMLLSNKGYNLTLAADGTEAWEIYQGGHFDLVITDIRMPNMDGMQLLRKIKELSPQTPIIVITAFGTIESAVEAMREGALDYVTKPFEEAKLQVAIDRALNIGIQAKVLRAIEQQEFQRVGGNKTLRTDTRFICATNKDLRKAVRDGAFRSDLFFRINVFPIELPALRQRTDDILPLANFFLRKFCREMGKRPPTIEKEAEDILLRNAWQGNVREPVSYTHLTLPTIYSV